MTDLDSDAAARLDADYEAIDVHYLAGRLTEYVEASIPLRDRALAIGDPARAAEIASWMTAAAVMSGDPRGELFLAETERLAELAHLPLVVARLGRYRAWIARFRGDARPLENANRRWLADASSAGDRQAVATARRALGEGLIEQGRLAEAEAELGIALDLSKDLGEAFNRTEILCALSRLALDRGDVAAADRLADDALAGVRPQDLVAVSAAWQMVATVRSAQHDDAAAEAGFREALLTISTTEYRERWVDASVAYARFFVEHGRGDEANQVLRPVERWLDEHGYVFRRSEIGAIRALIEGPPD